MSEEQDKVSGLSLAKQVSELASWLAEAPGFILIPDHFFDALDSMALTAAKTLGLEVPDTDFGGEDDPIDIVCNWLKENDK